MWSVKLAVVLQYIGPVHMGSQVTWGQSVQSPQPRAWKFGLTTSHGSQVLGRKYDMDAYMKMLFRGEDWDLYWELSQAKS